MRAYVIRRLLLFLPTLVLASLAVFFVMRALPGDVALVQSGGETAGGTAQAERVRRELGLDDPLPVQYARWAWSMVNGELGGRSLYNRTLIRTLVFRELPVTLFLTAYTIAIALAVSVPLGGLAAVHHNRWPDRLVRLFTTAGHGLPSFCVAILVLLALVAVVGWSPPIVYKHPWQNPWDHVQTMFWPAVVLAWGISAALIRVVRSSMLTVLRQDYIRTARAKGLRERTVLLRHAARNVAATVATVAGVQLGGLLGGAIIVEAVFGIPGIGREMVSSVSARDYPVVQSLAMLLVLLMLGANLALDILHGLLDPRARLVGS